MTEELTPPDHLREHGARLWREIATEYEIDDSAGLALLTTACECLDRVRAAQVAIDRDGEIVPDRYNVPKAHPACDLEKSARTGFMAALKQLNLDIEPLRDRPGRPPNS